MKIYLDLLPQQRKKTLQRKKNFRKILQMEFLFLIPFLVFIALLFNVAYVLNIQKQTNVTMHSMTESQDKYRQLSVYEDKFSQVNDTVVKLSKIQAGHLYWSKILELLSAQTPDNITISNFSTKNYQVFLIGKAKVREDLLSFKEKLESSQCFQNVNVPLSNLVVKDDVEFQMDFTINKDCLKK